MNEDFVLPPKGMLSERVDLLAHRLVLGLQHRDGEGIRICSWDGETWRHMTCEAALKLAEHMELQAAPVAAELRPVSEALRNLVNRVGEIEAQVIVARTRQIVGRSVGAAMERWRAQGLAEAEVEGHA
jgi:hypothetical protein